MLIFVFTGFPEDQNFKKLVHHLHYDPIYQRGSFMSHFKIILVAGFMFSGLFSNAQVPSFSEVGHRAAGLPAFETYEFPLQSGQTTVVVSTAAQFLNAVATATPGTVIEIQGILNLASSTININRSGTETHPIILRSFNSPGQNGFRGSSRINLIGNNWIIEGLIFKATRYSTLRIRGSNLILRQNTFKNCGTTEPLGSAGTCVIIGGDLGGVGSPIPMTGVKVYRNLFEGTYSQSLTFAKPPRGSSSRYYYSQNAELSFNTFRNIRERFNSNGQVVNGGEALVLGFQHKVSTIDLNDPFDCLQANVNHNLFDNARGDAEVISIKSSQNQIYKNALRESGIGAISLRYGHRNSIRDNRIDRSNEEFSIGAPAFIISGTQNSILRNRFTSNQNPDSPAVVLYTGSFTDPYFDYFPATDNIIRANRFDGVSVGISVRNPLPSGLSEPPTENRFENNLWNSTVVVPLFTPFFSTVYDYATFRLSNTITPEGSPFL